MSFKDERKDTNDKVTIVEEPIQSLSQQPQFTSERRMTRSQQSKIDKSLQSNSVIEQNEINTTIHTPKTEKKKNIRRAK